MSSKRPGTAGSSRNASSPSKNNNNSGSSPTNNNNNNNNNTSATHHKKSASMAMSPSASAATALLDQMERLLGDADSKFVDRSKTLIEAARNSSSGVTLHVDRGGASLRQQVAHNHTLMADRRFKEMLDDVERCLAPEFSLRGDVLDRALQAMLASLLKALLKESASIISLAARKVQIEMTYQWWQDKRREILDVVLSRMPKVKKVETVDLQKDASASHEQVEVVPQQQRNVIAALTGGDPRDLDGPPLSVAPCQPLAFKSDMATEKDRSAVAQNLRLYMKHDLAAAHAIRTGLVSSSNNNNNGTMMMMSVQGYGLGLASTTTNLGSTTTMMMNRSQPRVVMNNNNNNNNNSRKTVNYAGSPSHSLGKGMAGMMKSRMGNASVTEQAAYIGAAHENAPAGPNPFQHFSTQAAPRGHTDRNAATSTVEESLSEAHQRIIRHAARRMEDRFSEMESTDMNAALSHNRSRLLEETARKLESREYSSQTGRTTHLILSKVRQSDGSLIDARSQLPSARFEKEMYGSEGGAGHGSINNNNNNNNSSGMITITSPQQNSFSMYNSSARNNNNNATTTEPTSPTGNASTIVMTALRKSSYQGNDVSFSPYDHYQLRPHDEQKLKALMDRIAHPNDGTGELPPVSPKHAVFDDLIQVKPSKRNDLRVLLPKGVAGSEPVAARKRMASAPSIQQSGRRRSSIVGPSSSSGGGNDVLRSPTKSESSSNNNNGPLSSQLQQKATLHNLMRDLFPEVFDGLDELPPSMKQMEEMKLVDKIRDAFARRNPEAMPSYDRLVRALVTPDDVPHEVCLRHLPRPGSGLPKKFTMA